MSDIQTYCPVPGVAREVRMSPTTQREGYVRLTDHDRVVAEKDQEIARLKMLCEEPAGCAVVSRDDLFTFVLGVGVQVLTPELQEIRSRLMAASSPE